MTTAPSGYRGIRNLQEEGIPAHSDDIWVRVKSGFALPKHYNTQAVDKAVDWYLERQDHLEGVTHRAGLYLYYILTKIEERGLPTELSLIPVIESGYQPFATSPSDAAGLWQFIPSTGRRFGLKQTWWYDGRRDVVASTEAALDYLEYLYEKFDRDWLLAIAAYNAGEGTVLSAMKQSRNSGGEADFWSLALPDETSRYIPRLFALARIVEHPSEVGFDLPRIENAPKFAVVDVRQQVDLGLVAQMTGISMEELYRFNPAFNRWATDPGGPHRLIIPLERQARFSAGLEHAAAEDLIAWQRHEVAAGQTLSEIAALYTTTVGVLQRANRLKGTLIRTGRQLIVPTSSRLSSTRRPNDSGPAAVVSTGNKRIYVVRKGESLRSIARRHDTHIREITSWTGIDARTPLRPGQRLIVYQRSPSITADALVRASDRVDYGQRRYTVQRGDTLWTIARRFGVSVRALRQWNGIGDGEYLRPGQMLRVGLPDAPVEI